MVKAIFIGIDKHQGEEIPELSGARRDATALWTLFLDCCFSGQAPARVLESVTRPRDALTPSFMS